MFDRRQLLASMISTSVAWPMAARAQAVRKVARIGVVSIGGPSGEMTGPLPSNRNVRAFLRGMAELGYVYGREFVTEPRGTDSDSIAALVDLKVDLIVATGGGATLSLLKQATNSIPVVMTASPDPIGQGFAKSLADPGGNFTGMSLQSVELTAKRLQILKEIVPNAAVAAVFWDGSRTDLFPTAQAVGQTQGWKLLSVEIRSPSDIATAFKLASDAGAQALLIPASGILFSRASQITNLPR